MKTKIVSFKFTKKQPETKGKPTKTKKNYENIFNDILSGKKIEKNAKPSKQKETQEQKSENTNKKNKIKFISKLDKAKTTEDINSFSKNINIVDENDINNDKGNNSTLKTNKNSNNNEQYSNITESNEKKVQNRVNIIDEFVMNKSNEKIKLKQKKVIKEKYNTEQNKTAEQELILLINREENKNKNALYNNDKQHNYIKSVRTMKNNNKTKLINSELNTNNIKAKKISIRNSNNDLFPYKRTVSQNKRYNTKSFQSNINQSKEKNIKTNITKIFSKDKKILKPKTNNVVFKSKKARAFNTVEKITITSDSKKEPNYKDYISINNNFKKKRLILNNTNSNINININITNINDKNSKKEESNITEREQSKLNTENNYNSNITTVNIINNNNISKKISTNDYRLLFYNHSNNNNKHLPYQTKISSKGIKIESIDINLSEENDPPNPKITKFKFKKNLKKNNFSQNHKFGSETNDNSKEVQSEYEHFRDMDDFISNKSSTSFSCKSGFTVTRKLRSLSRERDKFKMMNNLKNFDKNKIDKIEDKLMNIVNKFHKDNSINNMNKKKRSNIILKSRRNNFYISH